MSPVLAAAQCAIQAGDIDANVNLHIEFMQCASEHGVKSSGVSRAVAHGL